MVDDLHSHFTGRYLPYGVWSERQLCGTHDGCTSKNRYSGYDLCAESAGSAQTATQSVTASSGKLLYLSIVREIDSFLVAPTTRSTSFPPLNRIKVGMPLIPYIAAVDGLSSTFSFTTARLPEYCSAIASTVGDNIRQGAHQAAQKSTSTGFFGFQNFVLKRIVGYFFNALIHFCSSFLLRLLVRNAREFLRLTPLLPFTSPRR